MKPPSLPLCMYNQMRSSQGGLYIRIAIRCLNSTPYVVQSDAPVIMTGRLGSRVIILSVALPTKQILSGAARRQMFSAVICAAANRILGNQRDVSCQASMTAHTAGILLWNSYRIFVLSSSPYVKSQSVQFYHVHN